LRFGRPHLRPALCNCGSLKVRGFSGFRVCFSLDAGVAPRIAMGSAPRGSGPHRAGGTLSATRDPDILTGGAHVAPPSSSSSMTRFSGTRRSPSISRFGSVIVGGNLEMVYPGSTASGDLGLLLLSAVDVEGGSRRYGRAAPVGCVNGPSSERAAATGLRRLQTFPQDLHDHAGGWSGRL